MVIVRAICCAICKLCNLPTHVFKIVIDYFPKNSNQSAFVVDTDCVFCEVGHHFCLQRGRTMVRFLSGSCHIFGKVAFFPSAFVSPASIIAPVLHTDLPLNTTLFRWTSRRSLGNLKRGSSYIVEHLKENTLMVCLPVFKGLNYSVTCCICFFFSLRNVE